MLVLADKAIFQQKAFHIDRNKSLFAETRLFWQNIWFRQSFGFSKWSVSVFSVSVKNLFRSDTTAYGITPLLVLGVGGPRENDR